VKALLHFVGHATYDERLFKLEAKRFGVNRALPPGLAYKLRPGDIVLLAFKYRGGARVFGYMVVRGYTVPASLLGKLSGVACSSTSIVEPRACGTITIVATCRVDDWDRVVEALRRTGKVKVFVYGDFYEVEPFVIPRRFTMSGTWVDIDRELPAQVREVILRAYDSGTYAKRPYTSKKLRRKLLQYYSTEPLVRWANAGEASKGS